MKLQKKVKLCTFEGNNCVNFGKLKEHDKNTCAHGHNLESATHKTLKYEFHHEWINVPR
jgi:hypothetical protein